MPTPTNRAKIQLVRGSYANISASIADLLDGELCYAKDQNKLYMVEGTTLTPIEVDIEQIEDAIAGILDGGTGINVTHTDGTDTITIDLADTAVTAGDYGSSTEIPAISVDAQGRITAVTSTSLQAASTSASGVVQLNTAIDSTSSTQAATPSAVKLAYDVALTAAGTAAAALPKTGGTVTGEVLIGSTGSIAFEGSTANDFETTITVTDPTADNTITFPDETGTVVTTGGTGTVTSAMILDGTIVNADISTSAAIAGSKITAATTGAAGVVQLSTAIDSTSATQASTPSATKIAYDVALTAAGTAAGALPKSGGTMTGNVVMNNADIVFEGSTADDFETTLTATDPTADRTITLPDQTGNVLVSGNASIVNADISASAAIADTKLATIGTAGKVSNSATTATDANTASAIVARDTSGNFSAGTITADLTGNADTATALETARTIGGVSFDGSANIDLPGVNTTGSQDTSGNAATATKLATARTIGLSGDATGSATFDGSANATITVTIADDSHNHAISNIDNLQTTLDAKAPLASPSLTGTPTAPTASAGTNTTQIATTAFVGTAVSNLVNSAPEALDTLGELAQALGDDANFSTTVTNSIATKLPLAGGEMTGNITFSGAQTVDGRDLSVDGLKLDNIEENAQVNVKADWNATTGDAEILNKPTIPSGVTDLGYTAAESTGTVSSSTGTDATIPAATTSTAGLLTSSDKNKLDGIAASATNVTDNSQIANGAGYITSSDSITGNAATATKLDSSRTFAVTGDVTGTVSSDLTSGASISTSIASGVIVDADVSDTAAIAGSKISPNFGTSSVLAGEAALTVDSDNKGLTIQGGAADVNGAITFKSDQSSSSNSLGEILFNWDNKTVAEIVGATGNDTLNQDNGSISFWTAAAGTPAKQLSIEPNGNILVSDGNRMEIDEIRARDGAGLKLFDDAGAGIFIEDGGNVGIGTSTPGARLTVGGTFVAGQPAIDVSDYNANANDTSDIVLSLNGVIRAEDSIRNVVNASGIHTWWVGGSDDKAGVSGASEVMRIDSSGRLGLGTSSPSEVLTVNGNIALTPSSPIVKGGFNLNLEAFNNIEIIADNDSSSSGYIDFRTQASSKVRILNDGKVGIGTTAPATSLHVYRGDSEGDILRLAGSTDGNVRGLTFSTETGGSFSGALHRQTIDSGSGTFAFSNVNGELLRIDAVGRLLVGTSSAANTSTTAKIQAIDSGSAGLILGRDDSSVTTDDTLGYIMFMGNDGGSYENCARIRARADGTHASGDKPTYLEFSTTADGASSPTERMRITNDGSIYVGVTTATIASNGFTLRKDSYFHATNTDQECILVNRLGTDGTIVSIRKAGTAVGSISVTGSATAYNTSSDYRLKENVVPLTGAADRLNQLQVHRFNFIADPDTTVDGFIAHEAQAVVPECVTGTKDEVDDEGNPVYQGIDQSKLVPLLTAALQEALAKIETLEQRLNDAGIA